MMNPFAAILFRYRQWAMARHVRSNVRNFAEQAERNPWIHEYRRVKAEVERTGEDSLFADFQRRFKQWEVERWGPSS
jgi:hypothetical protein